MRRFPSQSHGRLAARTVSRPGGGMGSPDQRTGPSQTLILDSSGNPAYRTGRDRTIRPQDGSIPATRFRSDIPTNAVP